MKQRKAKMPSINIPYPPSNQNISSGINVVIGALSSSSSQSEKAQSSSSFSAPSEGKIMDEIG